PETVGELPAVRSWLGHAEGTARIMKENYTHLTEPRARLMATVEENVLVQLEHLRTHPAVMAAIARQQVKLHGWVYKFETGQVFAYSPTSHEFAPLDGSVAEPPAATLAMPSI
ncbi:MAG TPA: carbonic anhydrase, partial [Lacipirellulaceae bacterium]|nr:carbonic anhydrase [Lacipirellulaceae bacterium]